MKRGHKRHIAYEVIAHLQDREAYTADDLVHELGIGISAAHDHLRNLWTLDLIYICAWDRAHQSPVAVYRWGNKPDVERPQPLTNAECRRRYWAKHHAKETRA